MSSQDPSYPQQPDDARSQEWGQQQPDWGQQAPAWGQQPPASQPQPPQAPPPASGSEYATAPYPPYGYQQEAYSAPPPYPYAPVPVAAPPTDDKAVWALVTSIAGFVVCPIILHIVGWVLASSSLQSIRESQGTLGGEGMAKAARILSIVGLVLYGVGILFFVFIFFFGLAASTGDFTGVLGV